MQKGEIKEFEIDEVVRQCDFIYNAIQYGIIVCITKNNERNSENKIKIVVYANDIVLSQNKTEEY